MEFPGFRARVTFILAAFQAFSHSLRPCPGEHHHHPGATNTYGINNI